MNLQRNAKTKTVFLQDNEIYGLGLSFYRVEINFVSFACRTVK